MRAVAARERDVADDVRWARATRTWTAGRIQAATAEHVPYPDDLAALVGYASVLKGDDWEAVADRLAQLSDA